MEDKYYFDEVTSYGIPDILAELIVKHCSQDDFREILKETTAKVELEKDFSTRVLQECIRKGVLKSTIYSSDIPGGTSFFIPEKEEEGLIFGTLIFHIKGDFTKYEDFPIDRFDIEIWRIATPEEMEVLSDYKSETIEAKKHLKR